MAETIRLIPKDHFKNVCRPGQGAKTCCLIMAGANGIECALGSSLEFLLRERARKGESVARSVNCEGPPEPEKSTRADEEGGINAGMDHD